jgi:hypothetical protein
MSRISRPGAAAERSHETEALRNRRGDGARPGDRLDGGRSALIGAGTTPPIAVEVLTPRSEFTDDVAIRIKVKLADGTLVYVKADDCLERPYAAGSVFVDPGRGNVHTASTRAVR